MNDMNESAPATTGPKTNIRVRLVGQDGNAFAILARVRSALRRGGRADLVQGFACESGTEALERYSRDPVGLMDRATDVLGKLKSLAGAAEPNRRHPPPRGRGAAGGLGQGPHKTQDKRSALDSSRVLP